MSFPFFNAVKGAGVGTAGNGSFTPSAAAPGFRAWSTVPAGWIGMVRYEDGAAWELSFGYWNGTSITRPANALFASSSGSQLSLTSAATAALINDALHAQPNLGRHRISWAAAAPSSTTITQIGISAVAVGTAAAVAPSSTNALTRQVRVQTTSATTANAQAGVLSGSQIAHYSTSTGVGGFEYCCSFGASQLPTGAKLFAGLFPGSANGQTAEPSALAFAFAAFTKDSTDANIHFTTNTSGSPGTKHADTGISLIANGWYQLQIWAPPGGDTIYGLLIRVDTGDIWFGNATTDLPPSDTLLAPTIYGALSATTGTAIIMHFGHAVVRTGI